MADGPYAPEFRAADVQALAPGGYDMPSPPQLVAKQTDPRIVAFASPNYRASWSLDRTLISPPEHPKPGQSRFVLLTSYDMRASYDPDDPNEEPMERFEWVNRLDKRTFEDVGRKRFGGGLGFPGGPLPLIRAVVREGRPVPELLAPHNTALWLVAPRVLDLLSEFGVDAGHYVTTAPRWSEDSDSRLADYLLFDPVRLIDSYDYDQSEFHVEAWDRSKSKGASQLRYYLTHRRAFREDIAPDVHLFRDLYLRDETVISRKLWRLLRDRKVRGLFAKDPAEGAAFFYDPVFSHLDKDPGPGVIDAE